MIVLRIISLLLLAISTTLATYSCPDTWAGYGDYCYHMSNAAYDYDTARQVCINFNGDLMAQNSEGEKNFTESLIYYRQHDVWFGLRQDDADPNNWIWTDGSQPGPLDPTLVNWACEARPEAACNAGEGVGPCGTYRWHSKKWENHPCDWSKPFVCRRPYNTPDHCDLASGWHQYQGRCYLSLDEEKSWHDAKAHCESLAGTLLMLKTQQEIQAFEHLQFCYDYQSAMWIGLSDTETATANTLLWVDNSTLTDTNWADGQPNYANPHKSNCVASYTVDNFKWRIASCGNQNKFMCQKEYGTCAEGWQDYGTGHCYLVVTAEEQKLTWPEARDVCAAYSSKSQIMKINDVDEQNNAMYPIYTSLRDANILSVRIGLSDEVQDNVFLWADGYGTHYAHWNDSLRQETPERMDCGYIDTTTANPEARWGTNYCFDREAYICRMPNFETPAMFDINTVLRKPDQQSTYTCEEGWVLYQSDCYSFNDETVTYAAAKTKCQDVGAIVTTVRDSNEQVFISNNQRGATWLALTYTGGVWIWDDGTGSEPTFRNWAPGGKNEQETKTCCQLQADPVGQWYNSHCEQELYMTICRKAAVLTTDPPPTEEPNSTLPWHPECGPNWSYDPYAQRCFAVRTGVQVPWDEARRRCIEDEVTEGESADLASITGPTEQQFLNALLGTTVGGAVHYWIGLNDRDQSKGWQWSDGEAVPYFNWNDGEPNNWSGEEWCVELSPNYLYRWNDHNCSALGDGYICKKHALSALTTAAPPATDPPVVSCEPEPMVSGNMYITDSNIRASSQREGREPYRGRMNSDLSWEPTTNYTTEYIEAFFPFQRIVERITLAGAKDKDAYVTSFRILYQAADGMRWQNIYNGSDIVIFPGNTAENKNDGTLVDLPHRVYAQGVRIYAVEFVNHISLRFDVHGCLFEEDVCDAEESVSNTGWVKDEYMTASHEKAGYEAFNARLSRVGWEAADPMDPGQYLQIEFAVRMTIIAITTMGRSDANRYVSQYKMRYYDSTSPHEDKWETYMEPYGSEKVFQGNVDNINRSRNALRAEISAEIIQIIPETYHEGKAMRVEVEACVYGCKVQQVVSGSTYRVDDSALTASSSLDGNHGPHRSRLYTEADGEQAGGWVAQYNDENQWLRVDVGQSITIRGIATQGRSDLDEWVKSYSIQYSYNGDTWHDYINDRDYNKTSVYWGAYSRNTERRNYLEPAILTRHIRVVPKQWEGRIAMRWDVLGCPGYRSYELIGCYADVLEDRDLPHGYVNDPDGGLTHEICVHHCYTLGYLYAGTQFGIECWCGNSYGRYGQSGYCDMTCSGDPFQICGGSRSNTVLTTGMAPDSLRCADGYTEYDGSCYKFVKKTGETAFSWYESRYYCNQDGAELASISSQAENDFVLANIAPMEENAWIGLHSLAENMFFEWVNYDSVDYTNWARREPNNMGEGEDCVNFYFYSGEWNDDSCTANYYGAYVCEKGKESLEPADTTTPDPGCGEGWLAYRWKCYHVVTSIESWDRHRSSCEAMQEGASLARIEDNQEQAFIASTLHGTGGAFWMDLNDRESPGTYKYTDGSSPSYTHWGINQPDQSHTASCVTINETQSGLWYDVNCDGQNYAVCEKPHGTETRPPTSATPPATGGCASGWEEFGDYCYLVRFEEENMRIDWAEAQTWCANHNANLTSIHSEEESDFLLSIQEDRNSNYWIGLSRATHNSSFNWVDGSQLEFVDWQDGEPSNEETHNCVQYAHENAKWETMTCNSRRNYICKIRRGEDVAIPVTDPYPTPDPNGDCEPNGQRWKYYNGHCYFFSDVGEQDDEYETWYDASAFCNRKGGHLVSIHSDDELRFCMGQSRNIASSYMWIGLNDINGQESWSDGSPVSYTYWAEGQPNDRDGTEMCVGMAIKHDNFGPWSHLHCSMKYSYICKKLPGNEEITTPLPSPAPGNCPAGYEPFLDKCYKFVDEEQTWNHSKYKCQQEDTDTQKFTLATIHNLQENSFLTAHLLERPHLYWIGMYLIRGDTGHGFGWVDSSQVTYTNWAPNEPNGGENEQCVHLENDERKAGQWNDNNCENTFRYICMTYKSEALPTPQPDEPGPCANYGEHEYDYVLYNGDCFKAASGYYRSWQAAEDHCQEDSEKGHLASIRNVYEQSFVYSIFFEAKEDEIEVGEMCWIGLSDFEQPGRFVWTDSAYVTYTKWGPGQPDQPGGGCVQFSFADSLWYDVPCEQEFKTICRISEQPIENTRPPEGQCPGTSNRDHDWVEHGNSCYMFFDQVLTYAEARQSCILLGSGSDLVSIHDNDTNAFILSMIQIPDFPYSWWTGMYRTPEGYQWANGDPVGYTNWAPGEPSDKNGTYGEDCVEMYHHSGQWNDILCSSGNGYVCMTSQLSAESTVTPEPSIPGDTTITHTSPPLTQSTVGPTDPATPVPTQAPTSTPRYEEEKEPKEPLSPGDIVGIVFGVVAVLMVCAVIALVVYRRKQITSGDGMTNPLYGESGPTHTSSQDYGTSSPINAADSNA